MIWERKRADLEEGSPRKPDRTLGRGVGERVEKGKGNTRAAGRNLAIAWQRTVLAVPTSSSERTRRRVLQVLTSSIGKVGQANLQLWNPPT